MAAASVLGEPEVLWGMEEGLIYGLQFDKVTGVTIMQFEGHEVTFKMGFFG